MSLPVVIPSLVVCVPLLAAAIAGLIASLRAAPPSRGAAIAIAVVAIAHGIVLAAHFPGLIISDALHVYLIGQRGVIDDYYGYLWPLALNTARTLFDHPATMGVLQALYFIGLLAWLAGGLRRRGDRPAVAVMAVLLLGLAPAALASVGYQHRDAFTALLSLHWGIATWLGAAVLLSGEGRLLHRALALQVLLLALIALARPELVVAGVATLAVLAVVRWHGGDRNAARSAAVAAAAVLAIPLAYTAIVTRVVPVEKRDTPYLVTLLAQPVGFILSRPDTTVHPGMVEAADRLFAPGKLVEMHTPSNVMILWSPHLLKVADRGAYDEFYRHSLRLIVSNFPEAMANRVMVYLHGNGYGRLVQEHQDQAQVNPEAFRLAGFEPYGARPGWDTVTGFIAATFHRTVPRALAWGTVPLLALALVVLFKARAGGAAWLVALAMLLRAAALFLAAPASQLAYHLSVMYLGIALVAMGLEPALRRLRPLRS